MRSESAISIDEDHSSYLLSNICVEFRQGQRPIIYVDNPDELKQITHSADKTTTLETCPAAETLEPTKHVDKLSILVGSYVSHNAGHVLGDEVWSAWQMMLAHDCVVDDPIVVSDHQGRHVQQWLPLTANVVVENEWLGTQSSIVVRFSRLLCGVYGFSYVNSRGKRHSGLPPLAEAFARFQERAVAKLSIPLRNPKPTVVFLKKEVSRSEHKHHLANLNEVVQRTAQMHPDWNVVVVNWSHTPLATQIQIMQSCDVVVSPPGSDLMNVAYMPLKSQIVLIPRLIIMGAIAQWETSNEIDIWFQHTHKHYTCLAVEGSILDRKFDLPQAESMFKAVPIEPKYRNALPLMRVSVDPLMKMIETAMSEVCAS